MKYLVFIVAFCMNQFYVHCQTVYKLEDLNVFVQLFSNCNCGDYSFNDSTTLVFELFHGKNNDTLLLKEGRNISGRKYLVDLRYNFFTVRYLSYDGDKRTYKKIRVKYFAAFPLRT